MLAPFRNSKQPLEVFQVMLVAGLTSARRYHARHEF